MLRAIAAVVVSALAVAQNAPEPEIVRAENSPYDLARYLETHTGFDWGPLWQALATSNPASIEPCVTESNPKASCSTEIVSLLNPDQAIVVVQGNLGLVELYLRFLQGSSGDWKFSGAYGAQIKNRDPMYQIKRLDGKPFLTLAIQGPTFGRQPNEKEVWFDLTQSDFYPAITFPTDSDQDVSPDGITRHVSGVPHPSGADAIDLMLTVDFDFFGANLGSEEFMGRFERHSGEPAFTLRSAHLVADNSPMPAQDFLDLEEIFFQPSIERMLVYALPGLKELAGGKPSEARDELRFMLTKCKDTPEKRELMVLMGDK